ERSESRGALGSKLFAEGGDDLESLALTVIKERPLLTAERRLFARPGLAEIAGGFHDRPDLDARRAPGAPFINSSSAQTLTRMRSQLGQVTRVVPARVF